jgi:hypothetical protein
VSQIAQRLPADGGIGVEEPLEGGGFGVHGRGL